MKMRNIDVPTSDQREQWFLDRVGKRIRRGDTHCCDSCYHAHKFGLIVHDKAHARYLASCSGDMQIVYYDTEEEMLLGENSLPKPK